jgi:hypothetical protein
VKRTRIKQISPTKKKHNELYRKAKKERTRELQAIQKLGPKDIPLCERCQSRQGNAFHHGAGRSGVLLWHKPFLFWLCNQCHTGPNGVHAKTTQAEMDGWIVRLTRDQYEEIRKIEQPKLYE